jgi:hypothetical protein
MSTTASKPLPKEDASGLLKLDPWLEPYGDALRERSEHYRSVKSKLDKTGGLLGQVSQGHRYFGFNRGMHQGAAGVW